MDFPDQGFAHGCKHPSVSLLKALTICANGALKNEFVGAFPSDQRLDFSAYYPIIKDIHQTRVEHNDHSPTTVTATTCHYPSADSPVLYIVILRDQPVTAATGFHVRRTVSRQRVRPLQ